MHPAINASSNKNEFPSFLKLADVIHVFKKGLKNSKHNYQTISSIADYADDNTPFVSGYTPLNFITSLEMRLKNLLNGLLTIT